MITNSVINLIILIILTVVAGAGWSVAVAKVGL